MKHPSPIARSESEESQPEWDDLLRVDDAARVLGVSFDEITELCETGALQCQRNKRGFWLIDRRSVARWQEAHPAKQPTNLPCPLAMCKAHFERRGELVPEFRADLGLCRRCYLGRPLPMRFGQDAS